MYTQTYIYDPICTLVGKLPFHLPIYKEYSKFPPPPEACSVSLPLPTFPEPAVLWALSPLLGGASLAAHTECHRLETG